MLDQNAPEAPLRTPSGNHEGNRFVEASAAAIRASDAKDRLATRVAALKDDLLRPPAGGGTPQVSADAIAKRLDAILSEAT